MITSTAMGGICPQSLSKTWLAQWGKQPHSMDAGQRVDIAHHIGMLIMESNQAGALQWGSSIYLQVVQQSVRAVTWEDCPPDNGAGLGFAELVEGDIPMRDVPRGNAPRRGKLTHLAPRGARPLPQPPGGSAV